MLKTRERLMLGDPDSNNLFIQITGGLDPEHMEREAEAVRQSSGKDWCLLAVPVTDWNQDLTPWCAPPVFGKEGFGDGAERTLEELLPILKPGRRCCLCGYSLSGFFALWAATRTDAFSGIVAASPSVWYPEWLSYLEKNRMLSPAVYLSLGDREERTRNRTMATVAQAIRRQEEILAGEGIRTRLEWNPGNHFAETDKRVARGISWILKTWEGEKE